jgi:hypothetical protein
MSDELKLRLIDMLSEGVPTDVIVDELARADDTRENGAELGSMLTRLRDAGSRQRVSKAHAYWMASVRRRLHRGPLEVPAVENLDARTFYEDYYYLNRPVFFKNLSNCDFGWSFERMKRQYGACAVEVMKGRTSVPERPGLEVHRTTMNFGTFIDDVQTLDTDDLYLTSANRAAAGPLGDLFDDFDPLPGILDKGRARDATALWIGPKGAVTPLHYDKSNVVLVEILGTKRVVLVPPYDQPFIYKKHDRSSEVDMRAVDFERFPLFRLARTCEITLTAGCGLFVPAGWWHFVQTVEPSFSASLTCFVEPNLSNPDVF